MDQKSKKQVIKKPTVVEGQGTGTSDEIKASVPEGSFVMPADSTAQLGVGRKNPFQGGGQVDVNLSNGEAVIPPGEAAAIGHDSLEQMKAATHTPVDQPQIQMGESGEPELFFANGGFIGSPYPSADDIRKAQPKQLPSAAHAQEFMGRQQQPGGVPQARQGQTYNGTSRTPNMPPSAAHAQEFMGRQQQPGGGLGARQGQTYNGQSRVVNPTAQAPTPQAPRSIPASTGTPTPPAGSGGTPTPPAGSGGTPTPPAGSGAASPGLGARAAKYGKGLVKGMTQFATAGGLLMNANTDSEQYRERFGVGDQSAEDLGTVTGFAKDFGVRGLGYASDVGNLLTGGIAGRYYQDNINREARQAADAKTIRDNAATNKPVTQKQPVIEKPKSLMENAGAQPQAQVQAPQASPQQPQVQQDTNPYAIQQKGNSFSYSNPNAAQAARTNGIPELQTQGVSGGMRTANDPRGVANLMANTREFGPTEAQLEQALNNRLQGMVGTQRQPEYSGLNEAQQSERRDLISAANAPIRGARGMTANQLNTLSKVQQGDEDRIQGRYQIDANNFANTQQTLAREMGSTGRTAMQEQGATGRTAMSEQGANYRSDSNLQHSYWRDGNNLSLDNRRVTLDEQKEGPGIRTAQRVESLRDKYANSTSDEEKQSLLTLMNLYGGKDSNAQGSQGKDRFITVTRPADPINGWSGGQALYDTSTGQWLDAPGAQPTGEEGGAKEFVKGATYTDPQSGKSAYLDESGNWVPYRGK